MPQSRWDGITKGGLSGFQDHQRAWKMLHSNEEEPKGIFFEQSEAFTPLSNQRTDTPDTFYIQLILSKFQLLL